MGNNICKQCDQQGICFENMQTDHTVQYLKKSPIKKWAEDLNRHSPKKKDGQQAHGKMLTIAN